jgi:hypothetical protein
MLPQGEGCDAPRGFERQLRIDLRHDLLGGVANRSASQTTSLALL